MKQLVPEVGFFIVTDHTTVFFPLYFHFKDHFYFQLLLEYDELSWKERDWFSVYSSNSASNFPQSQVNSLFVTLSK